MPPRGGPGRRCRKGLRVVASESQEPGHQTARATDEIGAQIAGTSQPPRKRSRRSSSITKTISKINEVNSGVASAVEEHGAATQEIARNVEQAAAAPRGILEHLRVSQAANETAQRPEQINRRPASCRSNRKPCAPRSTSSWPTCARPDSNLLSNPARGGPIRDRPFPLQNDIALQFAKRIGIKDIFREKNYPIVSSCHDLFTICYQNFPV